jgi:hypothetical protein
VTGVIDTGFITNHLAFATVNGQVLAYVTVGGENVVKVYSTDAAQAQLLATIPTGALPHGIWSSDDSSRVYVGLENGDGMEVIDPAQNKVIAHVAGGQAPQVRSSFQRGRRRGWQAEPGAAGQCRTAQYPPETRDGAGSQGLRGVAQPGRGRCPGGVALQLKPQTNYNVYLSGQSTPVASFVTDAKGMSNGTAIGPARRLAEPGAQSSQSGPLKLIVMEGAAPADASRAVLVSDM